MFQASEWIDDRFKNQAKKGNDKFNDKDNKIVDGVSKKLNGKKIYREKKFFDVCF